MKNYKFVIMSNLISEAVKRKLSLAEFLVLMYFDNSYDNTFDLKLISNMLKIEENVILEAFNSLLSKKIIILESGKDHNGKLIEKISLDNVYKELKTVEKNEEKKIMTSDIFSTFEREFGRPLSSGEIEVIKVWMERLYTEELILTALNEAVYNGVFNIRYIDKILYDWGKKGFKNKEDVTNYLNNRYEDKKLDETNIFEYNWLDENDL